MLPRFQNPLFSSGQGGNRTRDTRIFSPVLYQLSYLPVVGTARLRTGNQVIKDDAIACNRLWIDFRNPGIPRGPWATRSLELEMCPKSAKRVVAL